MAESSTKESRLSNVESENDGELSSPTKKMAMPLEKLPPSPVTSTKKGSKSNKDASVTSPSAGVIISRNKHWSYISSFQGPWLQVPLEILEIVAHINYNTPRPHPVDPAVVFDVLKIRKAVDEATSLAVGAANDLAPSTLLNAKGGALDFKPLGHSTKLSRDRKLRIRAQACQKLAYAYLLDEVACSAATMQSSSALEQVAGLVLQQNRNDLNAKYVHFFHEKIRSNQLVETTSLAPLTDIIESAHHQAEALRTRATVKAFREEFEGAIQDLTSALSLQRLHVHHHNSSQSRLGLEPAQAHDKERRKDIILPENDQPSGLVAQLLFQRASINIIMACRHVDQSINPSPPRKSQGDNEDPNTTIGNDGETQDVSSEQLEHRKLVKFLAKRALKDYTSFLSHFDYSPNLPKAAISEFNDRVAHAAKGVAKPLKSSEQDHVVYPLSDLFAAVPPSDLPPHAFQKTGIEDEAKLTVQDGVEPDSSEAITYHPLLTEALHALLLCHCLVQTSVKELQRHAYMVARLVRLCDGYPVFHAARSLARSDWVEVLRRTKDWLPLGSTWEALCRLTSKSVSATSSLPRQANAGTSSSDDRMCIHSEPSPQPTLIFPVAELVPVISSTSPPKDDLYENWICEDETKEYPFLTERTDAVARWILEVPVVTGTAKRKKRPKKAGVKADTVAADMSRLDMKE